MSKKIAVLHISDLHIADSSFTSLKDSRFQSSPVYLTKFIAKLNELSSTIEIKYLIVSGDVVQSAAVDEYQSAAKVLNEICEEMKIKKKNVIITPGNHDINWYEFVRRLKKIDFKDKKKFHTKSIEKFCEFKNFYEDFFEQEKEFNPEKVIIDFVTMEEELVAFLAINSNYYESNLQEDHKGFINIEVLKKELKEYADRLKEYNVFVVFHHTPNSIGSEAGTIENWNDVISVFEDYGINKFMCGHTHVSNAKYQQTKSGGVYYVVTGSLGIEDKDVGNTFLILTSDNDEKSNKGFIPMFYKWEEERGEKGYWQELTDKKDTVSFIVTEDKKGISAMENIVFNIENVDKTESIDENKDNLTNSEMEIKYKSSDDEYIQEMESFILDTIKKENLYVSGHFHWSEKGRSHSFIKTNYFFEKYQCIEKIKICYLKLIERNINNTNLLLGYGMQGSVIGSLIAIEKGWLYSYCPAVAKKYSEYEKNFPDGDFSDITVIIDLVYTNNIVKWLVKKLKGKYSSLKRVNICVLFYTNSEEFSLNEYNDIKICFYYAYQISINACPYKDKNDCIIYRENLDTVHILYSEEEK